MFYFASHELILGISVLLGVVRAFQMPTQQALTPQLVPQDMWQSAMALSSSGMQVAIIGGPVIGAMLYATGSDDGLCHMRFPVVGGSHTGLVTALPTPASPSDHHLADDDG